ncbi:uncharacterized protein Z518_10943 [Rhinocladiella mackenziei CBS 650.93]|uniref:DNA damage-binding protein 1 n=1 Tax=Rhinocladiella mackenziei CBS 650.93 TaxID=1442369 RepID=A0A0D2I9V9_9EURO|nr:uncharacterized protein Z518_10943 [Rhinocladiella mackenziei CBS 650.93]KIX00016.1 hypothetical protein Z518_10943 [Rhinocladiella mackenziei CBS 650.93]
MSYVVPIHHPSGVRHAIKLNFLDPNVDTLIVAKANRLQIYEQGPEGLSLLHTKTVYGYITILEQIRPASSKTDHLFVGTDRYQYFTCSWNAETKQLQTEQSYVDLADKVLRDSREVDRCHIDPTKRFMMLELYDGVISVLPFVQPSNKRVKKENTSNTQAGTLGEPVQVRIEELLTSSSAFLETDPESKDNPKLAILWVDNSENPQLKLRELKYYPGGEQATADFETVAELGGDQLDKGVSHLIPVPAPYSGFLILGDHAIRYVDCELTNVITQPLKDNATIWTCWTQIDDQRWLLADDFGKLFFLMIDVRGFEVSSWRLDLVGVASKAACLVYLDDGYVFIGSHSGDSQVVHIEEEGVRIVQTFANIAPILDFTIMDLGRGAEGGQSLEFSSGQARIVAASGAWQDGTIRSVRSGVGLEELGTIGELSHITDLWGLSSTGQNDVHDILLVSFVTETRIFKFDSEASVEELDEFHHLEFSQPTFFAANLPDRKLVQVYETGLRMTDLESSMLTLEWKPPDAGAKITAACANSAHLLVVEGGHTLHVFHISNSGDSQPTISKTFLPDSQISSVTVLGSQSNACIVSFWQTASVAIIDLHSLDILQSQTVGMPGTDIPRSVMVANILPDAPPNLFVAMADGTVLSYSFDTAKNSLSGMTRMLLGSEPVFFKQLPKDIESGSPLSNIFASCEQPSLVYSTEGRIIYSAVNAESGSRVCSFNSEAYPDAIAIATLKELKLALIGKERTTQLQTLPIHETVRCLTYASTAKMFAMGCIRRIMESGVEALLSSVKIADEVSFKELDSVELLDRELVECIVSTGPFDTDDESQGYGEMFVVGTSVFEEDGTGDDIVKGRILVFEVNKEKKLKEVTSLAVKGACRSLAMCDGKIVAGLVKTVVLYGLKPSTRSSHSLELTKLATYRTSTNPLSLAVTPATSEAPAFIAVADLMKSLSVLHVVPPNSSYPEYQLRETSRHFATLWSSATSAIMENEWVVADMEGNLIMLRQNAPDTANEDYRLRLEVIGEFRLGEVVNKIVPLSATPGSSPQTRQAQKMIDTVMSGGSDDDMHNNGKRFLPPKLPRVGPLVTPRAFLATIEGAIYMLATINPAYVNVLLLLQSALASRVQAPGYMPWTKFRAWKTEVLEKDEPFRVVDGEMVEQGLLALDDKELEVVLKEGGLMEEALNVTVEEVRAWGEELRRLY